MSFFISAILLILALALLVFLGVGLAIIMGVVLVIGAIAVAISFLFGGGLGFVSGAKGKEVPQKFNECLIEDDPKSCLEDWTTWDENKLQVVQALAKQVKDDLGTRGSSRSTEYVSDSINGKQKVRMELVTDYAKKAEVHEHYVLVTKDGSLKIDELKWDY